MSGKTKSSGNAVNVYGFIDRGFLNFIFTGCGAVCTVQSASSRSARLDGFFRRAGCFRSRFCNELGALAAHHTFRALAGFAVVFIVYW